MVLDSGLEIYVWVGIHSTEQEQEAGFSMAQEYLRTEPSQRVVDSTPIFLIRQRNEPDNFKDIFPSWNDNLWEELKSYDDIKADAMASNADDE